MGETVHIGEAAKLAGVSVDTIRFYQKLGLVQGPSRSPGGYRLFDGEQIHSLAFIRHAHELGFPFNEDKELLDSVRKVIGGARDAILRLMASGVSSTGGAGQ